jgi:hypothetical protein|tara:strand:+ start:442 stop:564 length:123 start_codon:yes stop_codon:yes gene_type:complete
MPIKGVFFVPVSTLEPTVNSKLSLPGNAAMAKKSSFRRPL